MSHAFSFSIAISRLLDLPIFSNHFHHNFWMHLLPPPLAATSVATSTAGEPPGPEGGEPSMVWWCDPIDCGNNSPLRCHGVSWAPSKNQSKNYGLLEVCRKDVQGEASSLHHVAIRSMASRSCALFGFFASRSFKSFCLRLPSKSSWWRRSRTSCRWAVYSHVFFSIVQQLPSASKHVDTTVGLYKPGTSWNDPRTETRNWNCGTMAPPGNLSHCKAN